MSHEEPERTRGEFRRATVSLPTPIVVDGSTWPRSPGPRTTGEFARATKSVTKPVVVDGSSWPAMDSVRALAGELVRLLAALDPEQARGALATFAQSVGAAHGMRLSVADDESEGESSPIPAA